MEDNDDTGAAGIHNAQSSINNRHISLGSPCNLQSIQDIETTHALKDCVFDGFCRKFTEFINQSLPSYGYALTWWFNVPPQFEVRSLYLYRMIST